MPEQTVTAKIKSGRTASVPYNFGETLEEAAGLFGNDAVLSNFKANAVIGLQGYIRRLLTAGKSSEDVAVAVSAWKPGVKVEKISDPIAAITKKMESLSSEAIEDLIIKLRARQRDAKGEDLGKAKK